MYISEPIDVPRRNEKVESDLLNMEMQKQETVQGDGKGFCITLSNARDLQH